MMKLGILDRFSKKTFFVFLLFFPFSSAFGAERILVPNHSRVERYISRDSLTQIKVEHSRIRNVFGDDNRFSYQYSDIDGSLFIKPILIMESEQSEKQNEVQNKQIGQNEQIQQEKKDRKDNGEKKEDKNSKNNFFKSVGRIEENKNGKDEKSEDGGKNKKGLEIQQGQKDQQQSQQIIKSEIKNKAKRKVKEAIFKAPRTTHYKFFTLSIVTEEGRSYTLVLTPEEKLPETLFLIPKEGRSKQAKIWETEAEYEEGLIELFRLMYLGQIPYGYSVEIISDRSSNLNKPRKLNDYLEYQLDKIYRGVELKGEVYTIKNISSDNLILSEQKFITPGTRAVSVEEETIPSGQTIRLFKVLNNE